MLSYTLAGGFFKDENSLLRNQKALPPTEEVLCRGHVVLPLLVLAISRLVQVWLIVVAVGIVGHVRRNISLAVVGILVGQTLRQLVVVDGRAIWVAFGFAASSWVAFVFLGLLVGIITLVWHDFNRLKW